MLLCDNVFASNIICSSILQNNLLYRWLTTITMCALSQNKINFIIVEKLKSTTAEKTTTTRNEENEFFFIYFHFITKFLPSGVQSFFFCDFHQYFMVAISIRTSLICYVGFNFNILDYPYRCCHTTVISALNQIEIKKKIFRSFISNNSGMKNIFFQRSENFQLKNYFYM